MYWNAWGFLTRVEEKKKYDKINQRERIILIRESFSHFKGQNDYSKLQYL